VEVLIDQSIETINLEENFNIRLVAIERLIECKNLLGMTQKRYEVINHITNDILIQANDLLLVFGKTEDLRKLASL
jgi:trk system potassium uptake protein TrkA